MASTPNYIDDFKKHRIGVILDDIGDEGRAAIVMPAQDLTASEFNHAISLSGGLSFVAVSTERAAALMLQSMTRPRIRAGTIPRGAAADSASPLQYISVEAREGVTTGISASDRSTTIRALGDKTPQPRKLVKPGHIFPVETRDGGVLVKAALPEAALDLVRAGGFTDAALFLDLVNQAGELYSKSEAEELAERLAIPYLTLSSLIEYRLSNESLVEQVVETRLPTSLAGEVRAVVFRSKIHAIDHVALVKGSKEELQQAATPVLVRVQVENLSSDLFGGRSRSAMHGSFKALAESELGVFLYLRRPFNSPQASPHQGRAVKMREYGVGAQILRNLGLTRIELLTSGVTSDSKPETTTNQLPTSLLGLSSFGIEVTKTRLLANL